MSSFFNDAEKLAIESMLNDVHDTFKKTVKVFIKEAATLAFPADFNATYGREDDEAKGLQTLTEYEILARIKAVKWNDIDVLDDIGLDSSENVTRLKVDLAGLELLKNSSTVEIEGERYSVISKALPIGPFNTPFYRVYLRRDG